ncbi:MAG: DUF1698 domain-containing protein [Lewinellaceae bacterium]|nr:DUF1698 domain-containing protein [Lewinellaceae bacterium]
MIRKDLSGSDSQNADPYYIPSTGEGNFENLVADYESKDRVIWQKPDLVISLLGDLSGKTVADIGAGTGYFAFRIVPKAQRVIGIDIDQRFINFMDSVKVRLPEAYRDRFEPRLAMPDDPKIEPEEVDDIIIVNTYGYIEHRINYLSKLFTGLKPGGSLVIIDFKKNNLPIGPSDEFKVSLQDVQHELEKAGFTIKVVDRSSLDYQYIVQALKPEPEK